MRADAADNTAPADARVRADGLDPAPGDATVRADGPDPGDGPAPADATLRADGPDPADNTASADATVPDDGPFRTSSAAHDPADGPAPADATPRADSPDPADNTASANATVPADGPFRTASAAHDPADGPDPADVTVRADGPDPADNTAPADATVRADGLDPADATVRADGPDPGDAVVQVDDAAPADGPVHAGATDAADEAARMGGDRRSVFAIAGRALRHRNFRLFTVGQSISLIGTWMQQVAVGWLVYRLTDSPFLLGLVGFVAQGPTFVLAPIAGVLADRYNKRTLVILTQAGMMVQAFVLAGLVLTDTVTIGAIVLLMGVLGALSGLDIPARQSFLVEMVDDREDLPNAIALNSSVFNGARLLGPAVAGLVVAAVGEGICILINAVSYVAVLASLFMMRTPARVVDRGPVLGQLISEGFRYVYGFRPLRSILLLVAFVSLVAVPFTVLLPVVATDVLGGGAETLGFLMAAVGLGALAGALYLASRTTVRGLSRVIVSAALLFGFSLVALALSRTLWLSLVCLAVAGFGMMAQMASSNTVLQTIVDDDKRGRVMSMYSMSYIGIAPLGALAGGAMASAIGAPQTIALGGLGCMLGALVFARQLPALRAQIRPIYAKLGIIPEVAGGIQAATHNTRPRTGDR